MFIKIVHPDLSRPSIHTFTSVHTPIDTNKCTFHSLLQTIKNELKNFEKNLSKCVDECVNEMYKVSDSKKGN